MDMLITKGKIDHNMAGKDCLLPIYDVKCENSLSKIKYGEKLNAHLTPIGTPIKTRSHAQLGLYWACCKLCAENYPDTSDDHSSWDTKDKVSEQCKIINRHVDYYYYYRNTKTGVESLNIKTKSIAFNSINHNDANEYFTKAFEVIANKLNISVDTLVHEAQNLMNNNHY